MAQFDYYRLSDGSLALDCQAEVLDYLTTRFAVPLWPENSAPDVAVRLNPKFLVDGESHAMVTQYAAVLPVSELTSKVGSLDAERYQIMAALDMLITGY